MVEGDIIKVKYNNTEYTGVFTGRFFDYVDHREYLVNVKTVTISDVGKQTKIFNFKSFKPMFFNENLFL